MVSENNLLNNRNMKNKKQKFQSVALIFLLALAISFPLRIMAATTGSDYWKTYFSDVEKKAVQKNAEKYTLSEIKKKSKDWHNVFTGFNIKNGSISSDDIKSIDTGKIKNLNDTLSGKLSTGGGTLSGLLTWASGQTFNAGNLTGTYAALDGSQITGITASQINAVPYSGATSAVDLGSKTITTTGTGNFGNIKTSIVSPDSNSISAFQINKADGTTNVLNVDTTNGRVGIGTTSPGAKLQIGDGTTNNSVDSQVLVSRLVDDTVAGNGHAFSDSSNISRGGTIGYNSFDARINYSGSNNFDHYAAFQAGPVYGSSGTLSTYYGFISAPTVNSGTVSGAIGLKVNDPVGSGTVASNYGILIDSLIKGGTNNYAIYTAGTTPSYFGGNVQVNGNIGIGIVPTTRMELYGTNQRFYMLDSGTGYQNIKLSSGGVGSMYVVQEQSTGGGVVPGSAAYSGVVGTGGANPLHFMTNSAIKATITSTGNLGIGTTNPVATLDVNGTAKLKKYTSEPFTCDATHDGTTALTSTYRTCVCNGGSTTWVYTSDGTTLCVWQ